MDDYQQDALLSTPSVERKQTRRVRHTPTLLHVMDASYAGESDVSFDQLFDSDKYDTLCAITYSSTFDVIYRLARKFTHLEIVFGCSAVLNGTISRVMASEEVTIRLFKENKHFKELCDMVRAGRVVLYLLKDRVAHEKLYCLSGKGGSCVITGSANMSTPALRGFQQEGITRFVNDRKAYNAYYKDFARAKKDASTRFDVSKLNLRDRSDASNEEALGMVEKEVKIYVPTPTDGENGGMSDDFQFVRDVHETQADKTISFDRKVNPRPINGAKHYSISALRRAELDIATDEETAQKNAKDYIHFQVDGKTGDAIYMGNSFKKYVDSTFPQASVGSDLRHLSEYIDSFHQFTPNNGQGMADVAWKLLAYAFASPFMANLRRASRRNGYNYTSFPMYAMVCGESDSSKTAMTKVISHLMSGGDPVELDSEWFTQTSLLSDMKAHQTGLPIYINDLTRAQWSANAGKILKQDNYETKNPHVLDPVTIITTNDIPTLKPEESKRCVLLRTTAYLSKTEALEKDKWMSDLLASLSPHLYIEYLHRMARQVTAMKEKMEDDNMNYVPDIALASSQVLRSICQEEMGEPLDFMRPLSIVSDYLGDSGVGQPRVEELKRYFFASPDKFEFKGKYVVVHFEHSYDANRYHNELPRELCLRAVQNSIICSAAEMRKIGIRKKHWFGW